MLQNNWDVFLFNPLMLLLLFVLYILILIKNIKIKHTSQKAFFIQTFLYWFALSAIIGDNFEFRDLFFAASINNMGGIAIIATTSLSLYAFLAMIPYVFLHKVFSRIGWHCFQYTMFGISMLGIFILIFYPSVPTLIIAAIFLGFGIITKASYFLSYNEAYGRKFFPFKTISLVAPLMTFALIFGSEFNNIVITIGSNLTNHLQIGIIGIGAIVAIAGATILYALFSHKEFTSTSFTVEQQKMFEPFKWGKVLIIFFMTILIIILKEVSQSNIYIWLLGQRTWEKYHDVWKVNQFVRLNEQLFLIPQFFGAYLACHLLYNKIGVKYCFGLGLLLWFIFFSITAFNHSPEAYLALQVINGLAFAMCFNILFAMTCEWKYRSPTNKPIVAQFQLLWFGLEFIIKFVVDVMRDKKVGIFKEYIYGQQYIFRDIFAIQIDNITTIISTICATIVLLLLLIFYYTSDLILAEYRNHLRLLVPKVNLLLRESFISRVKSNITSETNNKKKIK
ncbi:hypothetical protein C6B38_02035 [Spiroplasma sp. ChiS]|uniref:hypothetical protein n=1 Tax=Spiroplasma sp. ChiS TaxID=2099885 RepID=UPI000CF99C9E|nr:hypothetical protein [Spiroplasma sp. ChiS]PQP79223.1 hypothetical protein C6B38_02035 [Spiroplasma sp. ChiS]